MKSTCRLADAQNAFLSVLVVDFVHRFVVDDEGRMITITPGEVHILLFKICFPYLKPTSVILEPFDALIQSVGVPRLVPNVAVIKCETGLLMNQPLPIPKVALSDYAKIDTEFGAVSVSEIASFRHQCRGRIVAVAPSVLVQNIIELLADILLDGSAIVDAEFAAFNDLKVIIKVNGLICVLGYEVLCSTANKVLVNKKSPIVVDGLNKLIH
jgi:hypothetical protein